MPEQFHVVPEAEHEALVAAAYRNRGFTDDEANDAARFCSFASAHAVRTHNAIKALHLDDLFGSGAGGCVPGANIEIIENRFAASEVWNCNRKLGQSVAYAAIEREAAGLPAVPPRVRSRWPLDAGAAPMFGGGKRGAKA